MVQAPRAARTLTRDAKAPHLQDLRLRVNDRHEAGRLGVHHEDLHARDVGDHPRDIVTRRLDHRQPGRGARGHRRPARKSQRRWRGARLLLLRESQQDSLRRATWRALF
eukprot:634695-Prymnesium_polylepis.1